MSAHPHSNLMATEEYLGWTIECDVFERPQCAEFYTKSACFGKFIANKPVQGGSLLLIQPFWMSNREMRELKTDLDKQSALDYMLKTGRRAIKHSIRKHWKGLLEVPVTLNAPIITSDKWREQRVIVN